MNAGLPALGAGLGCWALAVAMATPDAAAIGDAARALVRPLTLPLLFGNLQAAMVQGDAEETFARAQALLDLLPAWSDGHTLFAWRFALDGGERQEQPAAAAAAALDRLRVALAWLELARDRSPRHGADLLASMAFLVEMAAERQPALATLLQTENGRPPAVIADTYLERAERDAPGGRAIRERRLFFTPQVVADLLRAGDQARALAVVEWAIRGCDRLDEPDIAAEWRNSLQRLARRLAGDRSITVADLATDPRLDPILPFLRDQ